MYWDCSPFADNIDFSACQEHNVIVWIYTPNDIDNSNDTAYFQIISDCSSSSSFISPSDNCYSIGDTLFLNNYQGNVVAWEASIDNGTNWTSISTPSDWYNPSNNIPIMVRTIVESPFGLCETDTILFNAPYNDFLMGVEAGSDTTIFLGDSMQLDGIGGTSFSWYPTSFLSNSAIANPVIWPDTSTVFYLESSDGSCSGIDSIVVTVVDVSQIYSEHENDLIIPNFLAKSSTWIIEGIWDYPENRILIYNLSGQLIYSANPYTNEFNVAHIPTGTYIYLINLGKDKQRIRGKIIVLN